MAKFVSLTAPLALTLLFAAVATPPAHAIEVPITEDEALTIFYQRNLDLISARYNIEKNKAQEIIAAAVQNPVVGVTVAELDRSQRGGNNGQGPSAALSVSRLIETAGKRRLRMESSALGTRGAEDNLRDAMRTLSTAVRHAFYALLLAQKNTELAKETVDYYEKIAQLNQLRLRHGDIPKSDLWRIKVEAFKVKSSFITTTAARDKARIDLAVLLRWPAEAMQFKAQAEWPAFEDFSEARKEELFRRAFNQRPDIQAARERVYQAEKDLTLAKKMAIPDVTVGVGYSHDPSNNNLDTANVSVSVPLPLFYQNKGEIEKAAIDLNSAQLQVQQLEQTIRSELFATFSAWESASEITSGFEKEVLQQVKDVREGAELTYLRGATNILDFIDAQRNYREVTSEYQTALYNRTIAYVDLLEAIGADSSP